MSWQMAKGNKTCQLFYQVPPHAWHPGFISGQKSTWTTHDSMLTLNRCGNYPQLATKVLLQAASELALHLWSVTILNKTFGNGFYGAAAVNLGKRECLLWFWGGSVPTEISRVWFTH